MYKKKKILLVVLARSGSKGIKNKNLRRINNIPLVGLSGIIASKIKYFDLKIISTDSNKIGTVAEKYGLKFKFKRPKNISGSKISDLTVLKHSLIKMEKEEEKKFDFIVSLPPTSPLRKVKDVENCIKKIINKKLDAVWTISRSDKKYHPYKALRIKNNKLIYFYKYGYKIKYRQQLDQMYYRNGACYVFSRKSVLKENLLPRKSSFVLSNTEQVSIDDENDLKIASLKIKI